MVERAYDVDFWIETRFKRVFAIYGKDMRQGYGLFVSA